ncbi:MAG: hypothetical protein R2717_03875 [Schumannella sp.]
MSDDAPTQRIDTGPLEELKEERQRSRGLLIGLIIAAALLLVAVTVIVTVLLLGRGTGAPVGAGEPTEPPTTSTPLPTESSTPEATPEATPDQTEQPQQPQQPSGPAINQFATSNTTVYCNTQSPNPSHQYISFSWKTSGASQIFFGVDTNDASAAALFSNLPPMGTSQNDFPPGYNDFEFGCPDASHKYTLTVVDGSGNKTSKSVTITNKGDLQ